MKIKEGFILRNVGGQNIVVATGSASESFKGMLKLNEIGAMLWKLLDEGADEEALVKAVTDKYDVDTEKAAEDVKRFTGRLVSEGFAE